MMDWKHFFIQFETETSVFEFVNLFVIKEVEKTSCLSRCLEASSSIQAQ